MRGMKEDAPISYKAMTLNPLRNIRIDRSFRHWRLFLVKRPILRQMKP